MASTPKLALALGKSLRAADLDVRDTAAATLARRYALLIDEDPDQLVRVGHLILPLLTALGLTPASRGAVAGKGGSVNAPSSSGTAVDDLRALRASRSHRAQDLDTATS